MIKYFYITTYNDNVSKEIFKYCHCPMDQKPLKNIWHKCKDLNRNKILGKSDYFLKVGVMKILNLMQRVKKSILSVF